MHTMIYMGMGFDDRIFDAVLHFKNIKLLGCVLDYNAKEAEITVAKDFLKKNGIREIEFSKIPEENPNMIFLCNYMKIINSDLLDKFLFVNIHASILPKWRGFNANCWAMLNG